MEEEIHPTITVALSDTILGIFSWRFWCSFLLVCLLRFALPLREVTILEKSLTKRSNGYLAGQPRFPGRRGAAKGADT